MAIMFGAFSPAPFDDDQQRQDALLAAPWHATAQREDVHGSCRLLSSACEMLLSCWHRATKICDGVQPLLPRALRRAHNAGA
jgi:hypothetical protein